MPATVDGVLAVEWQDVARRLELFARRSDIGEIDRWLVRELGRYLKEEGLADEEALSPATVFAFSAWPAAERTLARMNELTDGYVRTLWSQPTNFAKRSGSQQPNYGPGWWVTFPLSAPDGAASRWGKAWLEWGFRPDSAREYGRDAQAFYAGVSFQTKANPMFTPGNQPWLSQLADDGFERVQEWFWRLWRYHYPEQLLIADSLEDQAKSLADWIVGSFQMLSDRPPPNP